MVFTLKNSNKKILLSVIVCTYNRSNLLKSCLKSLIKQTLNKNLFETIIVNNKSTDNTQKVIEAFTKNQSKFRVVYEKKQGLSHARNSGWKEAKGEYVAFIDDDAKASFDWCEKILVAFKTVKPQPVAVGGVYYPIYETTPPNWFTDDFEIRSWGVKAGFLLPPRARYGFSGSNMAFKREILEEYNGFSSNYGVVGNIFRSGDETELFSRIYKQESRFWYDPRIIIFHWTPKYKFKISYRFIRAFRSGTTTTIINSSNKASLIFVKTILGFPFFCFKSIFKLMLYKGNKLTFLVKFIEKMGEQLGSIYALFIR